MICQKHPKDAMMLEDDLFIRVANSWYEKVTSTLPQESVQKTSIVFINPQKAVSLLTCNMPNTWACKYNKW
jgi:hypothetical protein